MSTEILDPKSLAETLKEKVIKEFVNLIPEATWDTFIIETVKEFQEKHLKQIIIDTLKEKSKEKIISYLNEGLWGNWDAKKQRNTLDEAMKNMLIASAPLMMAEVFETMAMNTMNRMRNQY